MKYSEMNFGQMEAVINKLGGMDGVQRLLAGETKATLVEPFIGIRQVKIGTLSTAKAIYQAIEGQGMWFANSAPMMLEDKDFHINPTEETISVLALSIQELGFNYAPNVDDIRERIKRLPFLDYGISELGAQIRIQYQNQPSGSRLIVPCKEVFWDGVTCSGNWFEVAGYHDQPLLSSISTRIDFALDDRLVLRIK
jgi:hypothetical protein